MVLRLIFPVMTAREKRRLQMQFVQIAWTPLEANRSSGKAVQLLVASLLPLFLFLFTLCCNLMQRIPREQTETIPRFDALICVSTVAEARQVPIQIRQYRVSRVVTSCIHHRLYREAITEDGTRFVAIGVITEKIKPGLVFQARTLPYPARKKQHLIWLEEYSPDAITDPSKLKFSISTVTTCGHDHRRS